MKIVDINNNSISKVSDKELINLHWRIHLLYKQFKKKNDSKSVLNLERKHELIVKEMKKRGYKHNTPL